MEVAKSWRVRFKRVDGYFCSKSLSSAKPIPRAVVYAWAQYELEKRPELLHVDEIINTDLEAMEVQE